MSDLLLEESEGLRGSGLDLSCYYYVLKQSEGQVRSCCVGRSLRGEDFEEFGGIPGRRYRFGFCAPGKGDLNACAVAQATHEAVLHEHGALDEEQTVRYSKPLPSSNLFRLVYIDDSHYVLRAPKSLGATAEEGMSKRWLRVSRVVRRRSSQLPRKRVLRVRRVRKNNFDSRLIHILLFFWCSIMRNS